MTLSHQLLQHCLSDIMTDIWVLIWGTSRFSLLLFWTWEVTCKWNLTITIFLAQCWDFVLTFHFFCKTTLSLLLFAWEVTIWQSLFFNLVEYWHLISTNLLSPYHSFCCSGGLVSIALNNAMSEASNGNARHYCFRGSEIRTIWDKSRHCVAF